MEYGFIDDTQANVLFLNNNYKELAEAVIKSILEYKNIPYTPPKSDPSPSPVKNTYTVKKGDTLYSISKKYNTTIDKLKQLNKLITNDLFVGQILIIPESSLNFYTVKKGDTLYSIASKNNTTVDLLKQLNKLNSNNLTVDQILTLPSTEIIEIPETIAYIVKKGDTLYGIAQKYNTTVEAIKKLNNIVSNNLTINSKLQIPTSKVIETPTTTKTHVVSPGDTLYSLARIYNTTVENIKKLNNLQTNLLTVGQPILISP